MSLVNLSHVCSHLQNASLARLGLTSIPYTRLHLSLSLLLQKQGFLSDVKLAGPSPPASCFPAGLRDNFALSAHPQQHDSGTEKSGERALARMVTEKVEEGRLRQEGFSQDALQWAASRRLKTKAQLEREGVDEVVVEFLVRNLNKSREELAETLRSPAEIDIVESHRNMVNECLANVVRYSRPDSEIPEEDLEEDRPESPASSTLLPREAYHPDELADLKDNLRRTGFDTATLRHFVGDDRFISERELANDGVDIDAMGLTITNQPFASTAERYADPWGLEQEGVVTQGNRASRRLWLGMKYWDGEPVLRKSRMVSKPTKRIYLSARELGKVTRGKDAGEVRALGKVGEVLAVSTDLGLMEARECAERRIGGMALCRVW